MSLVYIVGIISIKISSKYCFSIMTGSLTLRQSSPLLALTQNNLPAQDLSPLLSLHQTTAWICVYYGMYAPDA